MIKKSLMAVFVAAALPLGAMAEGYQVNSLSAKQIGMGHTGIALKLGAESMYFNPAGLGYMNKTLDLSGSVTGIMATCTATTPDGSKYETSNDVSTPLGIHAAFSIYDNFKAGVSLYTPYGSSINWTDNWAGAVLNQRVDLKVFTLQPTLSWRVTDNLSIGAGLMISWGNVDLNKGLVNAATFDKVLGAMQVPVSFGNTCPASVNLKGKAQVVAGVNVGVMWDVTDRVTVGADFRTTQHMKVKAGDAKITYANETAQKILGSTLNVLDAANFKAQMPAPWVLGLGVSYRPVDRLTLAFDARLTGWNAYDQLDIEFLSDQLRPFDQHITKNYRNAWCFSVGGQYALTDRLDLRAGVMIDTTPVNKHHYNPETPGMTKIEPSAGMSFRPLPSLSIDLGFMYVAGLGIDNASCSYSDLLAAQMPALGLPKEAVFTADYRLHAFIPAIGVSYSF